MLRTFGDELTEEVFHGIHTHAMRKKLPSELVKIAENKLDVLNCAKTMEDLQMLPINKNENAPVRDVHGRYSMPLWGSWRLAFRWNDGNADDVIILS